MCDRAERAGHPRGQDLDGGRLIAWSLPLLFVVARQVADAHLSTGEAVAVLVVDIVVTLMLAWIPPAPASVAPSASTRILESVHRYLTTHGHALLAVVLLVLFPYLVVHGLLSSDAARLPPPLTRAD